MEMMTFHEKVKTFPQAISQGNAFIFLKNKPPRCLIYGAKVAIALNFLSKVEFHRLRISEKTWFSFLCVRAKSL